MAWIEIIEESKAEGHLAQIYEEARKRAGRVYNILKIQSQSPAALERSLQLYQAVSLGDSPLTRAQREMLAVVVSKANNCHY
jgi:alkylhydroperoxidase family enzyme